MAWTKTLIRSQPKKRAPSNYGSGPLGNGSWDLGQGTFHFGPPVTLRSSYSTHHRCSSWRYGGCATSCWPSRPWRPIDPCYGSGWGSYWGGSRTVYVWSEPEVYQETVYVDREVEVPVIVEPVANAPAEPLPPETAEEPAVPPESELIPLDPVTERHLTEGSEAFVAKRYADAADSFRMAVIVNPNLAAPKFAFGQALIGMGDWDYAANVLRAALVQDPDILSAPGSIADVYESPEEFYTVLSRLKSAILETPKDPDLLFLLVYQYYFSGDPSAVPWFPRLAKADPDDPVLGLLQPALAEKFPEFANFPPPKR